MKIKIPNPLLHLIKKDEAEIKKYIENAVNKTINKILDKKLK